MRVALMQGPNELAPANLAWNCFAQAIQGARPDLLIMNEMPFDAWLAETDTYETAGAARTIAAHEADLEALRSLGVPFVLSSRSVPAGDRLANEAFVLANGGCRRPTTSTTFPQRSAFHESAWLPPTRPGFYALDVGGIKVGVLLCTELFFNEWAPLPPARRGADRRPACFGQGDDTLAHGGRRGCYRLGLLRRQLQLGRRSAPGGQVFGGRGFAFAPDGSLIAETSETGPVITFELGPSISTRQQCQYPCYVPELTTIPA